MLLFMLFFNDDDDDDSRGTRDPKIRINSIFFFVHFHTHMLIFVYLADICLQKCHTAVFAITGSKPDNLMIRMVMYTRTCTIM